MIFAYLNGNENRAKLFADDTSLHQHKAIGGQGVFFQASMIFIKDM